MNLTPKISVALIIAYPHDEILWAGGTILNHPSWQCFIVCLCKKSDEDLAVKFEKVLKTLKCEGVIGDLDIIPGQTKLDEVQVETAISDLLPQKQFDLILTHNHSGDYTRHLRQEEVSKAVVKLWHASRISTKELWTFAYENGDKELLPRPIEHASIHRVLSNRIWKRKFSIITEIYGFDTESWEARTTPKAEAFWKFIDPDDARKWIKKI